MTRGRWKEGPVEIGGNPHEIYFMLQRAAPEEAADLRLTVESAYRSDRPLNLRKRPNAIWVTA